MPAARHGQPVSALERKKVSVMGQGLVSSPPWHTLALGEGMTAQGAAM